MLPKSLFLVRLEDGRMIRAGLDKTARHGVVRLLPRDRVMVRLSSHDPTRGYVTRKLPPGEHP